MHLDNACTLAMKPENATLEKEHYCRLITKCQIFPSMKCALLYCETVLLAIVHVTDCGENCNLLLFPYNTSNSSLNKSCCCVNNCSHHSASAGDCTVTEQVKCHINGDNLQT